MTTKIPTFPLSMASENATLSVVSVPGGEHARRLCDLGLTVGAEITVRQREGAGLVVTRGGSRFAIGAGMAHKIFVCAA
jgi:ferrous iron transport protein A